MAVRARLRPTCGGDGLGVVVEHRGVLDLDCTALVAVLAVGLYMTSAARGAGRFDALGEVLVAEHVELVLVGGRLSPKREAGGAGAELGERVAGGAFRWDRLVRDLPLYHEVVGAVVATEATGGRLVAQVVRVRLRLDLHGRGRNEAVLDLQLSDRCCDLLGLRRECQRVLGRVGRPQAVDGGVRGLEGRVAPVQESDAVTLDEGQVRADAPGADGLVDGPIRARYPVPDPVVTVDAVHGLGPLARRESRDVRLDVCRHRHLRPGDVLLHRSILGGDIHKVDLLCVDITGGVGDLLLDMPVDALDAIVSSGTGSAGGAGALAHARWTEHDGNRLLRVGLVRLVPWPQDQLYRPPVLGDLVERVALQTGDCDGWEVRVVRG